MLYGSHGAKD